MASKKVKSNLRKLDQLAKKSILVDPGLNKFLEPIFPDQLERSSFVRGCFKRIAARRMLLRAHWYTDIADDVEKVRESRPALKLIFLIAMAEGLAKARTKKQSLGSFDAIKEFFKLIQPNDKETLRRSFQRTYLGPEHHLLRFSSLLKIFYEVRNGVVHGENFWDFSLLRDEEKRKMVAEGYTHYGLITSGSVGKKGKKRRVSIDTSLTYEELREIFKRTAIANIRAVL